MIRLRVPTEAYTVTYAPIILGKRAILDGSHVQLATGSGQKRSRKEKEGSREKERRKDGLLVSWGRRVLQLDAECDTRVPNRQHFSDYDVPLLAGISACRLFGSMIHSTRAVKHANLLRGHCQHVCRIVTPVTTCGGRPIIPWASRFQGSMNSLPGAVYAWSLSKALYVHFQKTKGTRQVTSNASAFKRKRIQARTLFCTTDPEFVWLVNIVLCIVLRRNALHSRRLTVIHFSKEHNTRIGMCLTHSSPNLGT